MFHAVFWTLYCKKMGGRGEFVTEQLALQNQLRDYLTEAQRKNPGFSLRALASRIKISPSSLCEILGGKRKVSKDQASKILRNLGADPVEQNRILSLFDNSSTKDHSFTNHSQTLQLTADQYHAVGDWHHFAILSLAETTGFKADPLWIAKRLGIKLTEAEAALERLQRLGLIQWRRSQKTLKLMQVQLATSDEIHSQAIRRAHQQDLELSSRAIQEIPLDLRDFTSVTMAIDAKKIPFAKKLIREFQQQMSAFLETGTKTEVYKICVHMLPLSKEIV